MNPFEITCGPVLEYYRIEAGWFDKTFATEADCHEARAFFIQITNTTYTSLWIEDIFFRLNEYSNDGLIPLFPNRERSFPMRLPVPLRGFRHTVEYAIPFTEIAPVVAKAIGIRIRYRNYYVPLPIYKHDDYSGTGLSLFIRALALRERAR